MCISMLRAHTCCMPLHYVRYILCQAVQQMQINPAPTLLCSYLVPIMYVTPIHVVQNMNTQQGPPKLWQPRFNGAL